MWPVMASVTEVALGCVGCKHCIPCQKLRHESSLLSKNREVVSLLFAKFGSSREGHEVPQSMNCDGLQGRDS